MGAFTLGREEPKPTRNVEAEAALLGALLIENTVAERLRHTLAPEHFSEPLHARMYERALELIDRGDVASPVTLKPYFETDEAMSAVGGVGYMAALTSSSAGLLGVTSMAAQVIELAARRQGIARLTEEIAALRDLDQPISDHAAIPFEMADLSAWEQSEPKPTEFLMPGLIPAREITLLAGAGGVNKSTFGQQLATCCAAGAPMLGIPVKYARALYVTAEDSMERLHWVQSHICKAVDASLGSLAGRLHLVSLRGLEGNELATYDQSGSIRPTARFMKLSATVRSAKAELVVLDNSAHFFPGNENDRREVTQFVNLLYGLVLQTGCTMVLVSHNSKNGGYSGSTAWPNAVRSRIAIGKPADSHDRDERILELPKANYGPTGVEMRFRWHDFALRLADDLPDDQRVEIAENAKANAENEAFLACLRARASQGGGREVGPSPGANYAPTQFETMPQAKHFKKDAMKRAMDRLFEIGKIRSETVRNKAKGRNVTVIVEVASSSPNASPNDPRTLFPNDPEPAENDPRTPSPPTT